MELLIECIKGTVTTIVRAKSPEWQAFERKLRRGKSIEDAATEAGIELDAAKEYLAKKRENAASIDDDVLSLTAAEAMCHGMRTLIAATKDSERMASEGFGEGRYTSYTQTDIEAAKTLLKFALDARKLLAGKKKAEQAAKDQGQRDLFDNDPWEFKEKD